MFSRDWGQTPNESVPGVCQLTPQCRLSPLKAVKNQLHVLISPDIARKERKSASDKIRYATHPVLGAIKNILLVRPLLPDVLSLTTARLQTINRPGSFVAHRGLLRAPMGISYVP